VLLPVGLNFLMWSISVGNVWLKLFPGSHKISGFGSKEIPHKRRSISCMFDDLGIPRLFLYKSKHSEYTSLFYTYLSLFCNVTSKLSYS
jgi:hypothetical protein